jgi:hypothetical protein
MRTILTRLPITKSSSHWLHLIGLILPILIALAGCQQAAMTTPTALPTTPPPTETQTPSTTPSPTVPPTHTATPAPTITPTPSAEAICPTTDEGTVEPQCQALVDFYQAAGGENLFNVTGWLSDQPICTWQGITCADGQVVGLDLTCGNMDILPPEIGQLTNLRELDLSGVGGACNNRIKELPPEIGQLSNLQTLDLSWNFNLTKLPQEIGQLSKLRILDLSINRIEELPPEIGYLTNLQELDLNSNPIAKLPPELCSLPNLQVNPPELCGN